ncbi:PHP domain-containing protein [Nitrincola sp. MINF-07-Sa-05]|uniref:PHP domain-containing protein n=1 Tax=Nitrincola salilacus TaxID=3400273 RepID=UPI003917BC7F
MGISEIKQPVYDLHCHSTASDGLLSPFELIDEADARGVLYLALTDHDTLGGLEAARAAVSDKALSLINGVELTCTWQRHCIHVLGLGFDADSSCFKPYLARLDALRLERAERIARKLEQKRLPNLLQEALAIAAGGQIGRPHFAAALINAGIVETAQEAFERFLGRNKAGDVKVDWPNIEEAVSVVKAAGGLSAIAHPTKYNLTFTKIRQLCDDFKSMGGDGLEISYPGVIPDHTRELQRIASQRGLLVSGGSDFHSNNNRWSALGRFPPLPIGEGHLLHALNVIL